MIVCNRCLEKIAYDVCISVRKYDGKNRLGREMIRPTMILCDQCIDELLKAVGKMKSAFLKEADAPEPQTKKDGES